jgi:hypothetical protein
MNVDEQETSAVSWNEESFRQYLLLFARKGNQALETRRNLPQVLELGKPWHDTLNTMRQQSLDEFGLRWSLVGANENLDKLLIPKQADEVGIWRDFPSTKSIKKKIEGLHEKGFSEIVGTIYSHSLSTEEKFHPDPNIPKNPPVNESIDISTKEWYRFLSTPQELILAEADAQGNTVVLKTKETPVLDLRQFPDETSFIYSWKDEFDHFPSLAEEAIELSKRYHVALYRGKPDQVLNIVLPKSS